MNLDSKIIRLFITLSIFIVGGYFLVETYWSQIIQQNINIQVMVNGFVFIQIFVLASNIALSARLRLIVKQKECTFKTSFKAINLTYGLNLILPGRFSEIIKPVYLKNAANISFDKGLIAMLLEKAFDILFVLVLILFSLQLNTSMNAYVFAIIGFLGFLTLIFLKELNPFLNKILNFVPLKTIRSFGFQAIKHITELRYKPQFLLIIFYTLLAWGFSILLQYIFLNFAGSIPLSFNQVLVIFTLTTIGGAIAILPAGAGTYEAAFIYAAGLYGYTFSEALILGLLLHLSNLLMPILISVFILTKEKSGIRSLIKDIHKRVHKTKDKKSA